MGDKQDEIDSYRERGERHAADGVDDHKPSDNLVDCLHSDATIEEKDAAYREGHNSKK